MCFGGSWSEGRSPKQSGCRWPAGVFFFFYLRKPQERAITCTFAEEGSKQQRSRGATTATDSHRHSGHRWTEFFFNGKVTEGSFDISTSTTN